MSSNKNKIHQGSGKKEKQNVVIARPYLAPSTLRFQHLFKRMFILAVIYLLVGPTKVALAMKNVLTKYYSLIFANNTKIELKCCGSRSFLVRALVKEPIDTRSRTTTLPAKTAEHDGKIALVS